MPHDVAIAVPACNEASLITNCLIALQKSVDYASRARVSVTVLVNNSGDATAARARAFTSTSLQVRVVELTLPENEAHAGGARRRAMDLAVKNLPDPGILMTTDADSRVDPDWIAANLVEIENGADAVAGVVTFAPNASVQISPSRHDEWQLAQLQARLRTLIDPRPHERWPTHIWAWGASLAVTAHAYRAVGGLPSIPLAEDRAFADVLDRHGFRVRRSHAPRVVTSHRRQGRAPGGLADLLSAYDDDTMPCDAALEPTLTLVRRLTWRARLRRQHATLDPSLLLHAVTRLTVAPNLMPLASVPFGQWWPAIESASPRLRRERVTTASLTAEIRRAERMISLLERVHPGDNRQFADA